MNTAEQRPSSTVPPAKLNALTETSVGNIPSSEAIPLPTESDRRLDRLWSEYESLEPHIVSREERSTTEGLIDYMPNCDMSRPLQVRPHQFLMIGGT